MPPKFPIDYNLIRKTLVQAVQNVTALTCITLEPETQNAPRPAKPYIGLKIINPGMKSGDDDKRMNVDGTQIVGGVRKMSVDFNCYGTSHEESYNYLTMWQSWLSSDDVQEFLRTAGIAVWTIGNVADLSQLMNTGYEGRAHMDCTFGIAVNLISNVGTIDSVTVVGAVDDLTITSQGGL